MVHLGSIKAYGPGIGIGTGTYGFGFVPDNLPTEIAKAKSIGLTDAELSDYLGGSASRIFELAGS